MLKVEYKKGALNVLSVELLFEFIQLENWRSFVSTTKQQITLP